MSGCRLHPHHGLCILFFEGRGYSPAFAAHMAAFIRGLTADTSVELTFGGDDICRACPRCRWGRCADACKVRRFDSAVLTACRLRAGQRLRWGELRERVFRRIIRPGGLERICADCQWADICRRKAAEMINAGRP